jgi:alpha-galactosidase
MFGGYLPSLDPFTRSLLTNAAVLAVNQHSSENKVIFKQGELRVWSAASGKPTECYRAVFNLADAVSNMELQWPQMGIRSAPQTIQNLRTGEASATRPTLSIILAPHASALYKLTLQ